MTKNFTTYKRGVIILAAAMLCAAALLFVSGCASDVTSNPTATALPVLTPDPTTEPTAEPTAEPDAAVKAEDLVGVWVGGNAAWGRDWVVFYEDGRYHNDSLRVNDDAKFRLDGTTLVIYDLSDGREGRTFTFNEQMKELVKAENYTEQGYWYFENDTLYYMGFIYTRETDETELQRYR